MARRYTEAEAQRVFARAAEQQRHDAPDDGLTLAELQEIGRAAGLDPAHVAAAVAGLDAPDADRDAASFLGVPSVRCWSRVLPAPVTDDAWERIVADLRQSFRVPGVPSQIGRVREWTATSTHSRDGLRVALEPTEGGTRATLEYTLADNVQGMRVLAGCTVGIPLVMTLFPILGGEAKMWMLPLSMLFVFGLVVALLAGLLHDQSRKTARQAERALDRMDLAVRDASDAMREASGAGRIDGALLDAPLDETDRTGAGPARTRTA